MNDLEEVKKVLTTYSLVKNNEPLNQKLIDRVARIIVKEFEIKLRFAADDGPVDLGGAAASAPQASHAVPTSTAPAVSSQQAHFTSIALKAQSKNAKVLAEIAAVEKQEAADSVDIGDSDEGEGGLESVSNEQEDRPLPPGTLPTRMSQVTPRETKNGQRSIRRAE